MDELTSLVEELEPDIIGITEIWTRPSMGDAEFTLPGYRMFRNDRKLQRGGGVIMYVKESIQAYEIQLEAEVHFKEAVWCQIETTQSYYTCKYGRLYDNGRL